MADRHYTLLEKVMQLVDRLPIEEKAQLVQELLNGADSQAILGQMDLSKLFNAIANWIASREI